MVGTHCYGIESWWSVVHGHYSSGQRGLRSAAVAHLPYLCRLHVSRISHQHLCSSIVARIEQGSIYLVNRWCQYHFDYSIGHSFSELPIRKIRFWNVHQ